MLEAEDIITLSNVDGGAGETDGDQNVGNDTSTNGKW